MNRVRHGVALVALGLGSALLVLLTRAASLEYEVINWDESTFILIASAVLDGHLPYTTLIDNKPPMIFLLLAGAMALFGESLLTVRLFGDVCVLVTALLAGMVAARRSGMAGAALAATATILLHWARSTSYTSSELPAASFLVAATWMLVARRDRVWGLAAAGLLISLATLTRSNLGVVAVAIGLLLAIGGPMRRGGLRPWAILPYTFAGLVPPALLVFLYWRAGAIEAFWLASVKVPLLFASSQQGIVENVLLHLASWAGVMLRAPRLFGLAGLLVLVGAWVLIRDLRGRDATRRFDAVVIGAMTLSIGLSIAMSGAFYLSYRAQIIPFFAILAGFASGFLPVRPVLRNTAAVCLCLIMASSPGALKPAAAVRLLTEPGSFAETYPLRAAAKAIDSVRRPGDRVWALQGQLILWYLDQPPVSPAAVHPENIVRPAILDPLVAAGYLPPDPLGRIYASKPEFVVVEDPRPPAYLPDPEAFRHFIAASYSVLFSTPGVTVYRLAETSPAKG